MASIFTFDPDPPRVSSPWSTPRVATPQGDRSLGSAQGLVLNGDETCIVSDADQISGLQAEPQEGPTEYKLHLLLRPRRSFSYLSTVTEIPGSYRSGATVVTQGGSLSGSLSGTSNTRLMRPASSTSSQQHRLQQLTTQLLWRLQQSSPYHATASPHSISLNMNDDDASSDNTRQSISSYPGLLDSKGALYEIGISDDGTIVGLASDEMDESLNTLRTMASTLGCVVNVLRMIHVGECEWSKKESNTGKDKSSNHKGKLWVAEAYVKPYLGDHEPPSEPTNEQDHKLLENPISLNFALLRESSKTPQLRVSLAGATMSGKSSLLGTLATSTLDNGRGKSRLSLLKHRHEIASGVTSSVAQELVGYCTTKTDEGYTTTNVRNCSSENISSWADIHSSAQSRLVFLLDSAGHPRYRRTAVRSLMGWAPHWTLFCMASNETDGSTEHDLLEVQLRLCLDLKKPLAIIITKLDLATKAGLRQVLAKLLSILKSAERKPLILPQSINTTQMSDTDAEYVSATILPTDVRNMSATCRNLENDPLHTVPIILTSAVHGTGIGQVHAMLSQLPLPEATVEERANNIYAEPNPQTIFQIDDSFDFSSSDTQDDRTQRADQERTELSVLSGFVQRGNISVGDEFFLGPVPPANGGTVLECNAKREMEPDIGSLRISNSLRSTNAHMEPSKTNRKLAPADEWRLVRVTSIRTLRLPVRTILADQVGTIGITAAGNSAASVPRVRKGMVLINYGDSESLRHIAGISSDMKPRDTLLPRASYGCVVSISRTGTASGGVLKTYSYLAANATTATSTTAVAAATTNLVTGSDVLLYFASVRVSAKILSVQGESALSGEDQECVRVSFRFNTTSEFVLPGTQVLVVPINNNNNSNNSSSSGGGSGAGSGMDGYVGSIIQGI